MGKSILPTLSTWWQWQGHFSDSVSNTSLGSVTTSMPASRTFTYPSSSMTVSGAAVTTAAAGSGSTAAGAGRQSCYWLICTFCDEQIDERFLVKYFMKIWFIIYCVCPGLQNRWGDWKNISGFSSRISNWGWPDFGLEILYF